MPAWEDGGEVEVIPNWPRSRSGSGGCAAQGYQGKMGAFRRRRTFSYYQSTRLRDVRRRDEELRGCDVGRSSACCCRMSIESKARQLSEYSQNYGPSDRARG